LNDWLGHNFGKNLVSLHSLQSFSNLRTESYAGGSTLGPFVLTMPPDRAKALRIQVASADLAFCWSDDMKAIRSGLEAFE
jgi:hypothetical protein